MRNVLRSKIYNKWDDIKFPTAKYFPFICSNIPAYLNLYDIPWSEGICFAHLYFSIFVHVEYWYCLSLFFFFIFFRGTNLVFLYWFITSFLSHFWYLLPSLRRFFWLFRKDHTSKEKQFCIWGMAGVIWRFDSNNHSFTWWHLV